MSKKIISVTDITGYLYCPRKVYLRMQGLKEPPNRKMILGFLKHKIFDVFNKNEQVIVSSINANLSKKEIKLLYSDNITKISQEVYYNYSSMSSKFAISSQELLKSVLSFMNREIELRAESIKKVLDSGFLGKEIWSNLKPKYLTEFELISENLGLKGRVDRIKFDDGILPYELKTREEIYDSDKLQLAAYALLLEDQFNAKVDKGIVESSSKQQIIELTKEMKDQVLELAEEIRNIENSEKSQQFHSNFSKCENCSFKEECFS